MLRVVYVDHVARMSGAEIALARLLPALENVEPHVVLAEDGPLAARLLRAGVSVEVLPAPPSVRDVRRDRVAPGRLPIRSAGASAIYTARLARRLRALRPDLVHTWSLKAALYGTAAARLARLPVVVHLHDRLAEDYLPGPAAGLVRTVVKRLPVAVVATSEATRRTLGDAASAAFVVHPPVEIDPRPRVASGDFRVGLVGRIARWKGQDVFLRAFAAAFPSGGARATLVGAPLFGEESYERELRSLCSELGLDGRVELVGFREDVAAELARLDVLVHASVVPEPFGQVVVEAMAAGVPIVAAAAGGPAEIEDDGVSGLLYEPGNVQALAAQLGRLRDDPALRDRLAAEGRRVAERFAPERVARELEQVYRRVCEAR
jgi:glycosyltransferase involved in cell wall biosynthesis